MQENSKGFLFSRVKCNYTARVCWNMKPKAQPVDLKQQMSKRRTQEITLTWRKYPTCFLMYPDMLKPILVATEQKSMHFLKNERLLRFNCLNFLIVFES